MTLGQQIMSGLRWTASVRLASQIFTWAITLVVVRLLSPGDYGLLAMAMVFVAFLHMFAEFGLGPSVVQKPEITLSELRKAFGLVLALHASLFLSLVVAAPLIAAFFDEPRLTSVVRALAALFLVSCFQVIPNALLQRRMEFRRRSLNDLVAAVLGSLMTLTGALMGWGVWALVAGTFVNQLWKSIGLNRIAPFPHLPDLSLKGTRHILAFGGNLTGAQILWFLVNQADVFIAGKWLGKELLGFYSVAMHLASLPNGRIMGIINQVAFPAFSRMQHDPARLSSSVLAGVRLLAFFAFPVLWGISSVAPEIVSVILGPKWIAATTPLRVLALIMPLRMMSSFMPNALQGIGRSDILAWNAVFAGVVMPVGFIIGVRWGGVDGLSLVWLVGWPLVFVENMRRALPPLGLRLRDISAALARPAFAGALMYATVEASRYLLPAATSGVARLAALIAIGALAYAGGALAVNRHGCREVLRLVRGATQFKEPHTARP
jgi:teichuronic acid exporter